MLIRAELNPYGRPRRIVRARRFSGGALALAGAIVGVFTHASCNTTQGGVSPPADRVWYPSALLTDPDGPWLYVVNSNSDLTFNSGTVSALDLERAADDRARGLRGEFASCPGPMEFPKGDETTCCRDGLDPQIINCDDRRYVRADRTLRIGAFGAAMVRGQPPANGTCPDCLGRVYVAVRADPSITVLDVVKGADGKPQLRCSRSKVMGQLGKAVDDPPGCGDSDKVIENNPAWNDESSDDFQFYRQLPAEPYALALDDPRGLLYVAHLTGGAISLIDTCVGSFPELVDVNTQLLPASVQRGFTALTLSPEDDPASPLVYAASRFTPEIRTFKAVGVQQCGGYQQILSRDTPLQGTSRVISTGMGSGDVRAVVFSPDPPASRMAYVLQRSATSVSGIQQGAPAIVFIDVSPDENGVPRDTPLAAVEVCAGATSMVTHSPDGDRAHELLYVTCYQAGMIHVVNPRSRSLVQQISAGRGPSALVFDEKGFGYVAGFGSNDIEVLDVREGSPTQFRIIQRLGYPSASPRQ